MTQPTNEQAPEPVIDETPVREEVSGVEEMPVEQPRVAPTVRSTSVTFPALK
ncbi:hypothetical protein [Nocardia sp. NPDC052566]|uniref:hypothetical protein n=1 Tax=Nocardia sp. NPDC052566 TaxID=3364330 RepID=UPI0037CAAF9D